MGGIQTELELKKATFHDHLAKRCFEGQKHTAKRPFLDNFLETPLTIELSANCVEYRNIIKIGGLKIFYIQNNIIFLSFFGMSKFRFFKIFKNDPKISTFS